jgi:hypothetical protein
MRPEGGERQNQNDKRQSHREARRDWPRPQQIKAPASPWNSKTMHHPAFRIGEIKRGKS